MHTSFQAVCFAFMCNFSLYQGNNSPPPSVPPHLAAAAASFATPSVSSRPPPLPSSAAKFDVFISYKHETISIECAKAVYERLTTLGFKVYFLDESEGTSGVNIGKEVTAAIRASTIFLPILSFEYVKEAGELWCLKELNFASAAGSKLLLVVIKGVEIPDDMLFKIDPHPRRLEYDPSNPMTGIANITRAVGELVVEQRGMNLEYLHVHTWSKRGQRQ